MPDEPASRQGPPEGRRNPPNWLDFLTLGTSCALSIVLGGGLGYLLDSWLNTTPWLTFAGLAFGITSAVMLAVVRLRQFL